ncbi:little elongation complex subunit 1 [Xyrichtys novacula]|uniref:Little elongation complex subunit 1 n=1 Tax=Xyrichtys novacula TaxID=13765 RepID=A0AAV1FMW3_XYRNO|nr:little elongation complex subunit 1 [Xyrichtys novacula]
MMPGDNQSKTVAIAADATVGNCQNCSVLHQSLSEYVSSFLALKQKITASDDAIRLQQQLEELQIRLLSLEKKTADYESMQAELEEKKVALQVYGQMSEEMDILKKENSNSIAEKQKLEDQLSDVKELMETQSMENGKLKREKAVVENDLLKAQTSLMKSQAQADQIEKLMEKNAKTTSIKEDLENKVRLFEDSICKQNHQITQLTKEKTLLERNIYDLQARLMKLEKERNKDYRNTSTQASAPEEHKVDKEMVRSLLASLWTCVEPQQHAANMLCLPGPCTKQVLPSSPPKGLHCNLNHTSLSPSSHSREPHIHSIKTNASYSPLKSSPRQQRAERHPTCQQSRRSKKKTATPKRSHQSPEEPKTENMLPVVEIPELSFEAIMKLFEPMPPCISPLPELPSESMETEDGEETNPDPLQQEEYSTILTSASTHSSNTSVVPVEDNIDSPVIMTQEVDHLSSENNSLAFERDEINSIIEIQEEEMQLVENIQIEQGPATEQVVSASMSNASPVHVIVDVALQKTDSQKPSHRVNSDSKGFDINPEMDNAKDNTSENITKMDVDTDLSAKTEPRDAGESLNRSDTTVISKEVEDVEVGNASAVPSTFIDSNRGAEVTKENGLEMGEVREDSCALEESKVATVIQPQKSTQCLAGDTDVEKTCLPSSSDSCNTVEERRENDAPTALPKEIDGNEVNGKKEEGVDVTAFPCASNHDNGPLSPSQSSLLQMENDKSHHDRESGQTNSETPSKMKRNTETLNTEPVDHGCSLSDPPETKTLKCESFKENTPSLCRALSPKCLFPTVKLHTLETNPNQEQLDEGVSIEHISTNEKTLQPEPNKEEESAVKNTNAKDLPEDNINASIHKVTECKLGTSHTTTSSQQSARINEEHNECKESADVPGPDSITAHQPEFLGQLLTEMGPPLPPVLTPVSTPPKTGRSINPRQAIGKLSFPSPMDRLTSPTTPIQAQLTPNSQQQSTSSLSSPVRGIPSSPLQFGSATPKHAVPVPGRLPRTPMASCSPSSSSPSQENSMRLLDTMYPDLSAHARTLSILRGNVSLSCSSHTGASPSTTMSQMSGFKTITSTSTAFTKAETRGEKRQADGLPQPNKRKCLRLENSPLTISCQQGPSSSQNSGEETTSPKTPELKKLQDETSPSMDIKPTKQNVIDSFLKKIEQNCFDLLPVIRSHLFVGNLPKKPVMTDEEKEVISEICQSNLTIWFWPS